jgi:hypothetical protein
MKAVGAQINCGYVNGYLMWQGRNPVQSTGKLEILLKFQLFCGIPFPPSHGSPHYNVENECLIHPTVKKNL